MSIETFLMQLSQYGTAPLLLVLVFIIGLFWRRMDKKDDDDKKRLASLQSALNASIDALKADFEKQFTATNKKIDELQSRVSCVERDYLPREEHYKEFSGWRAEINRLYDLIVNVFKEMPKK